VNPEFAQCVQDPDHGCPDETDHRRVAPAQVLGLLEVEGLRAPLELGELRPFALLLREDQRVDERIHRRVALLRIGLQAPGDHLADRLGHALGVHNHRSGALGLERLGDLRQAVAREGSLAMQRLVERHAQRELIGTPVDGLPGHLLRRHVGRRPHDDPLASVVRVAQHRRPVGAQLVRRRPLPRREHQAEVEHPRPAVLVDDDVVGLEVAVNQAALVRRREASSRLHVHRDDLGHAAFALLEPAP